ncbi:MAG: hypothetical protein IJL78_07385 [Lachnospiraceae bacterium]|nr:hypothetical protein [Lachnospiraceae bacterium]
MKKKVGKGHYGYIEQRKKRLLIQGILLMAGIAGFMVLGIVITGSNKNLFTLVAVMTAIPMVMQFVQLFALAKFHSRPADEYEEVRELAGNGLLNTGLVIANKDGPSYDIGYAYVHSTGIYMYCANEKVDTAKTEEYVRNFLRLNSCDAEVTILTDLRVFKKRLQSLSPEDRAEVPDDLLQQEGVLRAISM